MLDTHIIFNKVHTYIIFLCFGLDIFDVQSCFRDQYFGRSPCMCILATHIILMQVTYIYHVLWLALSFVMCSQIFVCLYFDSWTCRVIDVFVFSSVSTQVLYNSDDFKQPGHIVHGHCHSMLLRGIIFFLNMF